MAKSNICIKKFGKLPTKLFNIYHFDLLKLYENGIVIDKTLVCKVEESFNSRYQSKKDNVDNGIDRKGYSQLFDQAIKGLSKVKPYQENDDSYFEDVFINIDFKKFIKEYDTIDKFYEVLKEFENGIKLYVGNPLRQIHIVDFMKSNSMSKNCCMYYINKEYKDYINDRLTFGFDRKVDNNEPKLLLSKWYAYSGLAISDATILDDIKFKPGEIVVVPDKVIKKECDCITATSGKALYEMMDKILGSIEGMEGLNENIKLYTFSNITDFIQSQKEQKVKKGLYKNKDTINTIKTQIKCFVKSNDLLSIKGNEEDFLQDIYNIICELNEVLNNKNNTFLDIKNNIKLIKTNFDKYSKEKHKGEVYWQKFSVKDYPVEINEFDGEGLISLELCNEIQDILNKKAQNENPQKYGYSFQIRMPFIKGVVNSCDFVGFFKEHGINEIYGKKYLRKGEQGDIYKPYPIENVKIILTESQFKCGGFIDKIETKDNETPFDAYMRLLSEYDYSLGINNLEPKNSYFDEEDEETHKITYSKRVNLNYQFFSTIPFNEKEVDKIFSLNQKDYARQTSDNVIIEEVLDQGKSDIHRKAYNINKEFYLSTNNFKKTRDRICDDKKKNFYRLKLSTYGYRMFICGDLLELLYHCAFHLQKVKMDLIPLNKFYSPNTTFEENEKCFLLRNPHYSRNEVAVLLNHKEKEGSERQKYFGHLTGVLMYNPITQLADRLGGADYDGDSIVVIPAKYAAKAAQKIIKKNNDKHCALKYPVIKIPGLSADKKKMVYDEKVKCLFNTFDSRVGLISNNAFVEAFDLYKESKYDSQQDAIAYYTIVNGLEIDSAKQGIKPKMPLKPDKNNGSLFLKFKKDLNESKYFPKETYDKILNIDDNHIIFKLLKDVVTLKRTESSRSKFKTKINYDIVTDQHIIDICAIYSAYNLFLYQINQYRKYLTKKQINFQNETPLICKIKEILKSNGIEDYVSFCNNFARKIDSMEVRYNYYNADKKFHYLKDDESKREFIKDLGLTESLTEEEEKVIFNFKKEGYMLLYLLIIFITQVIKNGNKKISFKEYNINICLSNMISSFQKNLSAKRYFKRKDIAEDYFFRLLNHNKQIDPNLIVNDKESKLMEIKKNVYNLAEKINYEFGKYDDLIECTEYNCFSKKGLNKMYEKVCEFLKEKAKDIPLDAYLFIGKINESDFVFDVMSEQLEIYLKNLGDRNEK